MGLPQTVQNQIRCCKTFKNWIKMKNMTPKPLKWNWTSLIDNSGKFHWFKWVNSLPASHLHFDYLCKQFGPKFSDIFRAWSRSKLFDTLYSCFYFEKVTLDKIQKNSKFPSMQRVKSINCNISNCQEFGLHHHSMCIILHMFCRKLPRYVITCQVQKLCYVL